MSTINERSVPVFGDWHSHFAWAKRALTNVAKLGYTRAIHVGDFNIGFAGDFDAKIAALCQRLNITLAITPGNHDNYDVINALPLVEDGEWAGWQRMDEAGKLMVAPRGLHWNWSGIEFASLGGGNSIDHSRLTQGRDWWREEQITMADIMRVEAAGRADVMVAHVAPSAAVYQLDNMGWDEASERYADQARLAMDLAIEAVQPKVFFHGHYHVGKDQTQTILTQQEERFETRFISLGRNDRVNNLAFLDLETLGSRFVAWPWLIA
jgi:hypothetical protein